MKKKPYLQQNISNHKLDRSDKKANTNTSPEMKISCNVKQGTDQTLMTVLRYSIT